MQVHSYENDTFIYTMSVNLRTYHEHDDPDHEIPDLNSTIETFQRNVITGMKTTKKEVSTDYCYLKYDCNSEV